jgi:hypothetical protein
VPDHDAVAPVKGCDDGGARAHPILDEGKALARVPNLEVAAPENGWRRNEETHEWRQVGHSGKTSCCDVRPRDNSETPGQHPVRGHRGPGLPGPFRESVQWKRSKSARVSRQLSTVGRLKPLSTATNAGILSPHACPARCRARRRCGTAKSRSAPCLPVDSSKLLRATLPTRQPAADQL